MMWNDLYIFIMNIICCTEEDKYKDYTSEYSSDEEICKILLK